MFDVSSPNEEFREIKVLMNGFSGEKQKRAEEAKKLKEALKMAELKTEEKLRVDDIEGYTTSKNEEEFYRRKIKAIDEMKPVKVDIFKLRELIKEEREKVITEFEEDKKPFEEAFMKALTDLCDFKVEKEKRLRELRRLADSFNMKDNIEVPDMFLYYLKNKNSGEKIEVSYYDENRIEVTKLPKYGYATSIQITKG